MKKTVVLSCRTKIGWKSVNDIVGRIEEFWLHHSSSADQVELIRIDEPQQLIPHYELLSQAHYIVFTQIHYFNFKAIVRLLRDVLGFKARFIIHTHGEFSKGALTLAELKDSMTNRDLFVVSSQAEMKAARLGFSNIDLCCSPFPMGKENAVHSCIFDQTPRPLLIYAGRISEQKNIQTLLAALALLRDKSQIDWKLEIFGRTDGRGSPHVGRADGSFMMKRLRIQLAELRLQHHVNFSGFKTETFWLRQLRKHRGLFVSASLHSDENFGLAAFRVLENGGAAVLSGWGGHLDLARRFPTQVLAVSSHYDDHGPFLKPQELADAIETLYQLRASGSATRLSTRSRMEDYRFEAHNLALEKALKRNPKRKMEPLLPRLLIEKLLRRQKRNKWRDLHVFKSYGDPLIFPFYEAYGARRSILRRPKHRHSS